MFRISIQSYKLGARKKSKGGLISSLGSLISGPRGLISPSFDFFPGAKLIGLISKT